VSSRHVAPTVCAQRPRIWLRLRRRCPARGARLPAPRASRRCATSCATRASRRHERAGRSRTRLPRRRQPRCARVADGCLGLLCGPLAAADGTVVEFALDWLDGILGVGEADRDAAGYVAVNKYAVLVEEAGGMATVECLQQHEGVGIYIKAFEIMDQYLPDF
jgi:hypothetical protein